MIDASLRRLACAGILGLGIAALGGCNAETPSAPGAEKPLLGFRPAGGIRTTTSTLGAEEFKVCKTYVGQVGPAVTVNIAVDQGNNGSVDDNIQITVASGECWLVWEAGGDITDKLTVTEVVPTDYTASFVVERLLGNNTTVTTLPAAGNSAIETIINGGDPKGVVVRFTNTFVPPPSTGCTFTQGYWKNHAGYKKQADAWPAQSLTIGGIVYTKAELVAIMQAPTAGNGIMSLVQQLIAAKLNILNGASDAGIAQAIIDADNMIDNAGGKIVPPYTSPFLDPSVTSALNTALTNYNEGLTGPGHCAETDG